MKSREIPEAYRWATFAHPDLRPNVHPPDAVDVAQTIAEPIVVITGPTGAGKSILAAALAQNEPGLLWVSDYDIRGHYQTPEDHAALLREALFASVVVLDSFDNIGLGKPERQHPDDLADSTAEEVLEHRAGHRLRTIVTTICDRSSFASIYGERAA